MSEKFTPGPWEVMDDGYISATEAFVTVCRMFPHAPHGIESERDEANARLISAAPDMYEALVAFDAARTSPELHEALKLAHAALAKARGDGD